MKMPPLIPGEFVRRDNRFRATVRVNGRYATAHVPNSGRLGELFTPGRPVWLREAASGGRCHELHRNRAGREDCQR